MASSTEPVTDIDFSTITDNLPNLVLALKETASEVVKIVDDALGKVAKLKHIGVKTEYSAKEAHQDLFRVVRVASIYVDKVDDFFYYGQKAETEVSKSIKRGNYRLLFDVIDQLQRTLKQTEEFYKELIETCKKVQQSTLKAAEECKREKKKARESKRAAQSVGTIAAATAVTVGLGIFTLGASLPFTIGAVGAVGAAFAGTYNIAKSFEEAEETFRELSETFNVLEEVGKGVNNEVETIHYSLRSTATRIEDVEKNALSHACERIETKGDIPEKSPKHKLSWLTSLFGREDRQDERDEEYDTNRVLAWSAKQLFKKMQEGHKDFASIKVEVEMKRKDLEKAVQQLYPDK